jgi:hypothetical protein
MFPLVQHPSTPAEAWHVAAQAARSADGGVHLHWVLRGALGSVRVPAPGPVRRGDRLWEHTCAEAFVAVDDGPAYVELNVAPSSEWAAYGFTAYRRPAPLATDRIAPRVVVRRDDAAIVIEASVALADLADSYRDAALRVGLTMIVEAADGRLSYWALAHPSTRPDFHHADGFTLRLAAPRVDRTARGSAS